MLVIMQRTWVEQSICGLGAIDGNLHEIIKTLQVEVVHINPNAGPQVVDRFLEYCLILGQGITCDDVATNDNLGLSRPEC